MRHFDKLSVKAKTLKFKGQNRILCIIQDLKDDIFRLFLTE